MKVSIAIGSLAATIAAASPAQAQDEPFSGWFVRGAVTRLHLADKIDLTAGGAVVPDAGINTKNHYTPTLHIGHTLGRDFAAVLTVGLPPRIDINGRDALAPYGRLATTRYGPATATVQYRPVHNGLIQPYAGVGACYMKIFSETDGAFQNVHIKDDISPALEAGTDVMVTKRYGLFIEAKKAWLRTTATGNFGPAPVVGKVKLDPWAISAGAVIRF